MLPPAALPRGLGGSTLSLSPTPQLPPGCWIFRCLWATCQGRVILCLSEWGEGARLQGQAWGALVGPRPRGPSLDSSQGWGPVKKRVGQVSRTAGWGPGGSLGWLGPSKLQISEVGSGDQAGDQNRCPRDKQTPLSQAAFSQDP